MSPKVKKIDNAGAEKCADFIPNCQTYLAGATERCHTCYPGYTGAGGGGADSSDYETCDCAFPKMDNTGTPVCATQEIDNCKYYTASDKCYECEAGFEEFGGSTNAHDSCCGYPKIKSIDQADAEVCVDPIEGCEKYATGALDKCHTCLGDLSGFGGSDGAFNSCVCSMGT